MVLLSLVIFFSADMLDLKDRPTVEQIQIKFVLLLQKYINIRCVAVAVYSLANNRTVSTRHHNRK